MANANGAKTPLEFSLKAGNARFDFQFMEVPTEIMGLGGKKLATLIQLEGGTRVVQTFGNVPFDAITWKGIIFGPDSFGRWAELDGFRTSQDAVTLTYGVFSLIGVLDECELLPGFEGYLPYRAKFLPQADQSVFAVPLVPPQTTDQSGNSAVQTAGSAAANAQASQVAQIATVGIQAASAVYAAQQAMQGSLSTAIITSPGALGAAQLLVHAAAVSTCALFSTTDAINVNATVFPLYVALSALANLLGTLPVSPQVTVLCDGRLNNLFQLATRYGFGPDGWTTLSAANGGIPPFWKGLLSVIIPSTSG